MLGKYHEALGELEHLVVMWLFELAKVSMSSIGYKLHQQISKGLQHQSEAICKAITHYNVQATALTLPHPVVSWKDITKYTIL
ncbi:hypothetical protein PISMIDRAFT_641998, partial [Pisolithus microcarpus 441]